MLLSVSLGLCLSFIGPHFKLLPYTGQFSTKCTVSANLGTPTVEKERTMHLYFVRLYYYSHIIKHLVLTVLFYLTDRNV